MKPIGLSFKNQKFNLYTNKISGELMVIHLCLTCGRISANRIAGDDNPYAVLSVFEESIKINTEIKNGLANLNIQLLSKVDKQEVFICLFGNDYHKYV